jgi:hypothetical protein
MKIDASNLGNVVIFHPKGENATLEVYLKEETVWLTQAQMTELFQTERSVITKHIRNILQSKELRKDSVCAFFAHTAQDGKMYNTQFYSLDMIISVGYQPRKLPCRTTCKPPCRIPCEIRGHKKY